jgi:NAD-dependent SIR2 family protein deacetylase
MGNRTVSFIFGAGASAAEGAPVIKNFLQKAYELFPPNCADELTNDIWHFLMQYYNNPLRTSEEVAKFLPSLDEVFTNIDYAINNNFSLTPFYSPERLLTVRKSLISLINKTLSKTISGEKSYQAVVDIVLRSRSLSLLFVSLNYDCIIDKCLDKHNKLNYGFTKHQLPVLIKLHGSLNWSYCSLCEQIQIHKINYHRCNTKEELKCRHCGNSYTQPVLITPTLFKSYDFPPLKTLWSLSLKLLSSIDKVVFIGYSLPTNDVAVIQLFKRAFAIKGKRPEIMVVDINQEVHQRYQQIFGDKIAKIVHYFSPEIVETILKWLKK